MNYALFFPLSSSRLPTPGAGPTGGRSPSFTNLKTNDRRQSTAPHQTGLQRERSFVERNFVETLKQPQVQVGLLNGIRNHAQYCLFHCYILVSSFV